MQTSDAKQQHGSHNDRLESQLQWNEVKETEGSKMQNSFLLAAPTHSALVPNSMTLTKLQHILSTYNINYNTKRQSNESLTGKT